MVLIGTSVIYVDENGVSHAAVVTAMQSKYAVNLIVFRDGEDPLVAEGLYHRLGVMHISRVQPKTNCWKTSHD